VDAASLLDQRACTKEAHAGDDTGGDPAGRIGRIELKP